MSATLARSDRGRPVLWGVSFAVTLAAHVGLVVCVLARSPEALEGEPSEAIAIELSPEPPSSVAAADAAGPPDPEPTTSSTDPIDQSEPDTPAPDMPPPSEAEPPTPEPEAEPPPPVEVPEPAVAMPPERPKIQEPVEKKKPQPQRTTPSTARAAAMQAAAGGGRPSAARVATWRSSVSMKLARNKRYPAEARARNQQGAATVVFTLDRAGRVLSRSIAKSSGVASLDQESLAMVHRSQPFPTPPPNMPAPITIVAPVHFSIR